ncbi:zf-HC2 domain-containing protein [Microtetraspora glauca]|uniref:Zf-HC2 domain-containing protein n=1 Tax=Microtetraspora glauca TaxID=1996 RepID=A0ABV3GP13_MICGL
MSHPTDLLAGYAAGVLPGAEGVSVSAHLEACPACAAEVESWRRVGSAVRERAAGVPAPAPALFAAILGRLGHPAAREDTRVAVPRFTAEIGGRPLRRALGVLARQRALIGWPVWALSASVLAIGTALAALGPAGFAERVLGTVVPLVAALAVAGACGSDREPIGELVAATPTSPRAVLLARLTLVLGTTVAGSLLVTLALLPLAPGAGMLGLAAAWFGPLVPLSALSFALSVLWRPSAGVGAAMALWVVRVLGATGEIDRNVLRVVEPLWAPDAGVVVGAAVLVGVTVLLAPRLSHGRVRRAGF